MPNFVRSDNGYVNLDHVVRTSFPLKGDVRLYDAENRDLGAASPIPTGVVVAAAAGTVAEVVTVSDDKGRPTEADVYVVELPVAAWRIQGGSWSAEAATPILVDDVTDSDLVLIKLPSGKRCAPGDQTFDDLEGAKRRKLAAAQYEWDRKHPAAA